MSVYETEQQHIDLRSIRFNGGILDIGGGGDGIITRHSGDKVVAIDLQKDELEEIPDVGLRIVMDARELGFLDNSFDCATCFYSLMYMTESTQKTVIGEIHRVLKPDGELWIWDATIPEHAEAEVFVAQLNVQITDDEAATPGYGVGWTGSQSIDSIKQMCIDKGFVIIETSRVSQSFVLRVRKEGYD